MSESESPQQPPDRDETAVPPDGAAVSPAPIRFGPAEDATSAQAAEAAPDTNAAPGTNATDAGSEARRGLSGARAAWLVAALVCVIAGVLASVLGARSLARSDAAKAQRTATQSAEVIGTSVMGAIQHQEDLTLTAAGFFSDHPTATAAEFHAWAKWVKASRRYPELAEMRLVTPVAAAGLAAFEARTVPGAASLARTSAAAAGSSTALVRSRPAGRALHIVPPGERPLYCFAIAGLARSTVRSLPAGTDYCARTPGLLAIRDSGVSHYAGAVVAGERALRVVTPVYRGGVAPASVAGRRTAFVGWLQQVLLPEVVLSRAVAGHTGAAARLRYRGGAANLAFTSGSPAAGALATATSFHNGWSLKSFVPVPATGVSADGRAVALLIGGCVLSVLIGALVLMLGLARGGTREPSRPKGSLPEDLYDPLTGAAQPRPHARPRRAHARPRRPPVGDARGRAVHRHRLVQGRQREARHGGRRPAAEDRRRAPRAASCARSDTVGRLGGDEFVVLVESAARGVRLTRSPAA